MCFSAGTTKQQFNTSLLIRIFAIIYQHCSYRHKHVHRGPTTPSNRHKGCAKSAPYIYICIAFWPNGLIGKVLRGGRGRCSELSPPPLQTRTMCMLTGEQFSATDQKDTSSFPTAGSWISTQAKWSPSPVCDTYLGMLQFQHVKHGQLL